jgi:DNA-binding NarL/FixJ family response regulator
LGTRILLADDSPLMRKELRRLLEQNPGWEICGEAVDGRDAIDKVEELGPDLVVLDLVMPRLNGLEAAREIAKHFRTIPMLICTMYASPQLVEEARNAGARGIVSKAEVARLVNGIQALFRNETFFVGF